MKKTDAANKKREARVAAMFDADKAKAIVDKYGYSQEIYELLFESRSNVTRLEEFLEDETFSCPTQKRSCFLNSFQKGQKRRGYRCIKRGLGPYKGLYL